MNSMNELVEANTEYQSLADKLEAVVPVSQTMTDNSFIRAMYHGTLDAFRKKFHVNECHTAADLVNHTLNAYPANLNTGEQFTFLGIPFPRKNGLVNMRVGSTTWMEENRDQNFGDAAYGPSMSHFGDHHFTTLTIGIMIPRSLLPTAEGWRQHNETLHSLIHHSHGQLGTDLTQSREDPILLMNARVCSPYVRPFMTLVRSPLYSHMLRNKIAPVFVFRGMMLQSPRAGQYVISTQDSGKHGHTLIAIMGGVQGCAGTERFKSLDHFPRTMHIQYRRDGQGNDLPRLTNDVTDNATDTDEETFVPFRVNGRPAGQHTTPGVNQRLFGPAVSSASASSAARRRSSPYGTSGSASTSGHSESHSSAGSPHSAHSASADSVPMTPVEAAAPPAVTAPVGTTQVTPTPAASVVDLTEADVALDRLMAHIENNYEEFITRELQQ